MDLVKALQSLSKVGQDLSHEQLSQAKTLMQNFEFALEDLASFYEQIEGQSPDAFLELIAKYETIRDEILSRFE